MGEYVTASPCEMQDIPQNDLEAVLIKHASQSGTKVRWNTEYLSHEDLGSHVVSTCRDLESNKLIRIQSRFMCGADGGRSKLVSRIGAVLTGPREDPETCYSITFTTDMAPIIAKCPAFFNFAFRPTEVINPICMAASIRIIRPWHQCQIIAIPLPGTPVLTDLNSVDWKALLLDLIGDSNMKIKIDIVTKWRVNEVVANYYSKGNVFCLGDAFHRHPPANGLGSNTSVQDSYNLAWKLAYVLKGIANPKILDTYNTERQPVGQQVVKRANDSWRIDLKLFAAMGMHEPDLEKRRAIVKDMEEDSQRGRELRTELREAISRTREQFASVGCEMNHLYQSDAIYIEDEGPDSRTPVYAAEKDTYYTKGTIPGMRLPHAWLATEVLDTIISTQDLAGHGRFTLFTGIGGNEVWTQAATAASASIPGLKIAVFSIGWGQDYLDTDNEWDKLKGVDEDGAVLVRPDRFVCWRAQKRLGENEAASKLTLVLNKILSWE
ncbi:FAD binding domain-containing protein [Ilyonectria destructans]|nr:FAD binding domain-containing protein [Ilyonectria destructans]